MNPSGGWIKALTVGNYALLSLLWLSILVLYARTYHRSRITHPVVSVLAAVLAFDAFKSVVENVYFGALWTGRYGIAFEEATTWLSRPRMLLVPKLVNLAVAVVILLVVLRRWIPTELRAHEEHLEREAALREDLRRTLDEVRAQEERWQLAMRATEDGIWDYDVRTRSLWTSPRFDVQLGYEPGQLDGRPFAEWSSAVHEDDRARAFALLDELVTGRATSASAEVRLRGRDGAHRLFLCRAVTQADEHGKPIRIVCSQSDVTDLREAEAALAARQRVESLGMLAGGIAHDVNNLLAAIRGNAELARSHVTNEVGRAALRDLDAVVRRASELTGRLLAYSGHGRFAVGPVDLSSLGLEMTRLLRSSTAQGAQVETSFADDLPPVEGDAAQLQQLVLNLYGNAVDALEGRPGTVSVRTRRETVASPILPVVAGEAALPPGEYVVLEVEDTGIGMTPETRLRIFEPFFSSKGGAHGLGLSAMLGVLRAHHAGLRVRTAPGAGSTFTVYFKPATVVREPISVPPPPSSAPRSPPRRRRALLADDEASLLRLFRGVLEEEGFDVTTAENGRQALDALEAPGARFAVALLDVTMPEVTGTEVLATIRDRFEGRARTLPVVLMSGYAVGDTKLDEHTMFLQKPFSIDDLRAALGAVIRDQGLHEGAAPVSARAARPAADLRSTPG